MTAYTSYVRRVNEALALLDEIKAVLQEDCNKVIVKAQNGDLLRDWGKAGTAGYISSELSDILDSIKGLGEYVK